MSKTCKTQGIVLRKIDLGEADQIVTLLTPTLGKISCLAKGCRKLQSKFCGRVELLHRIEFTAYPGRSLWYLHEAEVMEGQTFLDFSPLGHGVLASIAEVTHRLVQEGQGADGVYWLVLRTLSALALKKEKELESVLYSFFEKLLMCLGFMDGPEGRAPRMIDGILQEILNSPLKSARFLQKMSCQYS